MLSATGNRLTWYKVLFGSTIAFMIAMCIFSLYFNISCSVTYNKVIPKLDTYDDAKFTIYDSTNNTIASANGLHNLLKAVVGIQIPYSYYIAATPILYEKRAVVVVPVTYDPIDVVHYYSSIAGLVFMDMILVICFMITVLSFIFVAPEVAFKYIMAGLTTYIIIYLISYYLAMVPKLEFLDMLRSELMPNGAMICGLGNADRNNFNATCKTPQVHCSSTTNCMDTMVCNPKYDCQQLWKINVIQFYPSDVDSRYGLIIIYPIVLIFLGMCAVACRYFMYHNMYSIRSGYDTY